jgi:hypothetical protein
MPVVQDLKAFRARLDQVIEFLEMAEGWLPAWARAQGGGRPTDEQRQGVVRGLAGALAEAARPARRAPRALRPPGNGICQRPGRAPSAVEAVARGEAAASA